jgi:hypothetical protein
VVSDKWLLAIDIALATFLIGSFVGLVTGVL